MHIKVLSLLAIFFCFSLSAQIIRDCNNMSYADIDQMCGWHGHGGDPTDATNASNRGRRATQAEWNSCTSAVKRSLHCPDSLLTFRPGSGPNGQLSPPNVDAIKAEECAQELASFENRLNPSGEKGPTHEEWKSCLNRKGLYGILNEYKGTAFFKRYNKKNKKVRENFCDNLFKKWRPAEAEAKAQEKNCKNYINTGIALSIPDDEFSTHITFSHMRSQWVCYVEIGYRENYCGHLFDGWNPPENERQPLTAQCRRYTENKNDSGEAYLNACGNTARYSNRNWPEFEAMIKEKRESFCKQKIISALYAEIIPYYTALIALNVSIRVPSTSEPWQSIDYSRVEEDDFDDVATKLDLVKTKIKSWLDAHKTYEGCKTYDALNAVSVIRASDFADYRNDLAALRHNVSDDGRSGGNTNGNIPSGGQAPQPSGGVKH